MRCLQRLKSRSERFQLFLHSVAMSEIECGPCLGPKPQSDMTLMLPLSLDKLVAPSLWRPQQSHCLSFTPVSSCLSWLLLLQYRQLWIDHSYGWAHALCFLPQKRQLSHSCMMSSICRFAYTASSSVWEAQTKAASSQSSQLNRTWRVEMNVQIQADTKGAHFETA